MEQFITFLNELSFVEALVLFSVENVLILVFSTSLAKLVTIRWQSNWLAPFPPPISRLEIILIINTMCLNTLVTIGGWALWREGIVTFRNETDPATVLLDLCVLLAFMDFAMYVLHRLAHHPILFPWLHETHHKFKYPRPITLFALHPAEAIAFGGLWLVVITVYSPTWIGMSIYLGLNVVFGIVGHLGVEFLPARFCKIPALRNLAASTFHCGHHLQQDTNFGFYTLIWDRLFKTIVGDYDKQFTTAAKRESSAQRPLGGGEP